MSYLGKFFRAIGTYAVKIWKKTKEDAWVTSELFTRPYFKKYFRFVAMPLSSIAVCLVFLLILATLIT